jgi:hypothetical protein
MDKATIDEIRKTKRGQWLKKATNTLTSTKGAALRKVKK